MMLIDHDTAIPLEGLEEFPGTLTVIGCDDAGPLIETSFLANRQASYVTARLRARGWFPQGRLSNDGEMQITFGRSAFSGCACCERCQGLGLLPLYLHINNGTCFACEGVGYLELSSKATKAKKG